MRAGELGNRCKMQNIFECFYYFTLICGILRRYIRLQHTCVFK